MTTMAGEPEQIEELREHLLRRWLTWGLAPLVICATVALLLALWGPQARIAGKQQIRFAFEIVLGAGAAVFLAGFYIDGHWTSADRVACRIFRAAGGNEDRDPRSWAQSTAHRSALRSNADIALSTIRASADAITLMGVAIGLIGIACVLVGLPTVHAVQLLLLGLFYQFFVFSRHPYYMRLAMAALSGELLPPADENDED